jgi:hypothetical protein
VSFFDAYLDRMAPPYLRPGAPPPQHCPEEEWQAVQERARSFYVQRAAAEYAERLQQGWHPDELAVGELSGGAKVSGISGRVFRPLAGSVPDLAPKAAGLLEELSRHRVRLEAGLPATLEAIATQTFTGRRATAEASIREAEVAVSAAKAQREQAKAEQAALKVVRVSVSFRSNERHWPAGEHRVTEDELDDLLEWQERHEAFARLRGWERPEGFAVWPPFELEE